MARIGPDRVDIDPDPDSGGGSSDSDDSSGDSGDAGLPPGALSAIRAGAGLPDPEPEPEPAPDPEVTPEPEPAPEPDPAPEPTPNVGDAVDSGVDDVQDSTSGSDTESSSSTPDPAPAPEIDPAPEPTPNVGDAVDSGVDDVQDSTSGSDTESSSSTPDPAPTPSPDQQVEDEIMDAAPGDSTGGSAGSDVRDATEDVADAGSGSLSGDLDGGTDDRPGDDATFPDDGPDPTDVALRDAVAENVEEQTGVETRPSDVAIEGETEFTDDGGIRPAEDATVTVDEDVKRTARQRQAAEQIEDQLLEERGIAMDLDEGDVKPSGDGYTLGAATEAEIGEEVAFRRAAGTTGGVTEREQQVVDQLEGLEMAENVMEGRMMMGAQQKLIEKLDDATARDVGAEDVVFTETDEGLSIQLRGNTTGFAYDDDATPSKADRSTDMVGAMPMSAPDQQATTAASISDVGGTQGLTLGNLATGLQLFGERSAAAAEAFRENVGDPAAEVAGDVVDVPRAMFTDVARSEEIGGVFANTGGDDSETVDAIQDVVRGEQAEQSEQSLVEGGGEILAKGAISQAPAMAISAPETAVSLGELGYGGGRFTAEQIEEEGAIEGSVQSAQAGGNFAANRLLTAYQQAQANPLRTAGVLIGTAGIMGGAAKLSSGAGLATRAAIQPGEELIGYAGNRALGTVSPTAARTLFPDNEPLLMSEESAIRGAKAAGRIATSQGDNIRRLMSAERAQGSFGNLVSTELETETEEVNEVITEEDIEDVDQFDPRQNRDPFAVRDKRIENPSRPLTETEDITESVDPTSGTFTSEQDIGEGITGRGTPEPAEGVELGEEGFSGRGFGEAEQRMREAETPSLEQENEIARVFERPSVRVQPGRGEDTRAGALERAATEQRVGETGRTELFGEQEFEQEAEAEAELENILELEAEQEAEVEQELEQEFEQETEFEFEQEFEQEAETETELETEFEMEQEPAELEFEAEADSTDDPTFFELGEVAEVDDELFSSGILSAEDVLDDGDGGFF